MTVTHVLRISFEEILPVWRNHLWVERQSPILPMSTMVNGGGIDLSIRSNYSPYFFGAFGNNRILGVLSGHSTSHKDFRLRGLYVYPDFRGQGVASKLLSHLQAIASLENRKCIWTFPRQTSWPVYQKFGFIQTSPWTPGEIGANAYASMRI